MSHEMVETAFRMLYPEKPFRYQGSISYTNQFKPYGANVRKHGTILDFRLCARWRHVDEGIVVGLLQELLVKLFSEPRDSINIDLYNHFVQHVHLAIPKTECHAVLAASFDRVNERYFAGLVERPNLVFGGESRVRLGSYDFKTDTITISALFREQPDMLDYIMHHEILHKHLKYTNTGGRSRHHTPKFRMLEKRFENADFLEERIKQYLRSKRPTRKSFFDYFVS